VYVKQKIIISDQNYVALIGSKYYICTIANQKINGKSIGKKFKSKNKRYFS